MKNLWILLLVPFLMGAAPTKSTTFVSQTTARAAEVNTNFDDLYNYLSVGVDTLRVDAVDAITEINSSLRSGSDQSLITGTAGTNEQIMSFNSDGDAIALSTMTGNVNGIKIIGVGFSIDSLVNCSNLGTDAQGIIICN